MSQDRDPALAEIAAAAAAAIASTATSAAEAVTATAASAAQALAGLASATAEVITESATNTAKIAARQAVKELHSRRWKYVFIVLAIDLTVTPAIGLSQWLNNRSVHDTQNSLRATQIDSLRAAKAQCELDNSRANATKAYQEFVLAQQRKGLEDIKKLPAFNTPEIRRLALDNQQRQIDATEILLKAFVPADCTAFVVPAK